MAVPGSVVGVGKLVTPGGASGPVGQQGPTGPTGPQGPTGPTGPAGSAVLADPTQNGLLRKTSGNTTDFVDGTNNYQPLSGITIPWTGVSGKPSTFPPAAHASTHNPGAADPLSFPAWTAYTAGVSAGAGTVTSVSNTSAYLQLGKLVFFRLNLTITNIGSASGAMYVNLPVATKANNTITFREGAVAGVVFALVFSTGSTTAQIIRYDNNNPTWANNFTITATGSYEAA